ncbi:methyl-accepting chemotaxis protein [Heliobacterium chlorum]|uniref:Methyl-accepting chemotaxis protein n=1 Tax=Heliobacterium chlorum TaxID=2698 RepID=A0ABR7SZJ0_HELCL|nr:methyl-accepting chemotaxis protein [Heliobacterium chlorum]MBC9783039.1 methyl-accepting chemotaxis protein [Heliobacterium chlorum]
MKLQTKLMAWTCSTLTLGLVATLTVYGFWETQGLKERVEGDLTSKGEALIISATKGLEAMTNDHIRNSVKLPNGTTVGCAQLTQMLFDDELTLIPESKLEADKRYKPTEMVKRFDGVDIPMAQYEYKYMSKADPYTDTYWQQYIDAFMGDPDVVFALPTKYSADPAKTGFIPTHNSLYSPTDPEKSRDNWGAIGLLSQKYRANRIFNDLAGGTATANENRDKPQKTVYERKIDGRTVTMWDMSYPIYIDGKHWGSFRISISKERADQLIAARTHQLIWKLTIVAIVSLIGLAGTSILIISLIIVRPIHSMVEVSKKLAQGDFTHAVDIRQDDEVGMLGRAFNHMIENVRSLVDSIMQSSRQVNQLTQNLQAAAIQTANATEEIAHAVQEVSSGAMEQERETEQTASLVRKMTSQLVTLTSTAQEVAHSSSSAFRRAGEGQQSIRRAIEQMGVIHDTVSGTAQVMQSLGSRSTDISRIVEVITAIADQTNLLALNAAIEAARAGEHGRGFSVVAEEVRKLAEQSRHSAQEIARLVEAVQTESARAVTSVDSGTKTVEAGLQVMQEAGHAFQEILGSVHDVEAKMQSILAAVQQIAGEETAVMQAVDRISHIAQNNNASSRSIAFSSQEQTATMEEIAATTEVLAKMANSLDDLVCKFILNKE